MNPFTSIVLHQNLFLHRYYANTPPPCVGVFSCKMKEGERSPSPVGATGRRASSTTDELFHSPRHAEVALRRMEAYYARGQLCDVTLVAGESQCAPFNGTQCTTSFIPPKFNHASAVCL